MTKVKKEERTANTLQLNKKKQNRDQNKIQMSILLKC